MRRSLLALALGTAVAATPAHAQLRGIIKKAAEKVQSKDPTAAKAAPVAGEALTEATLNQVLAGAQAADRLLATRDAIAQRRRTADSTANTNSWKNSSAREAYGEASGKIADCRSATIDGARQKRDAAMEERFKNLQQDPAMMGKMAQIAMKYSSALQAAQASGDAAAMQKVQTQMMVEMTGSDPFKAAKADTAAAEAKCGKLPPKPAALVEEDRLAAVVKAADDSIRVLEGQALNEGAQAAKMDKVRYAELKERTLTILTKGDKAASSGYGADEVAAVQSRRADLLKVKRAL